MPLAFLLALATPALTPPLAAPLVPVPQIPLGRPVFELPLTLLPDGAAPFRLLADVDGDGRKEAVAISSPDSSGFQVTTYQVSASGQLQPASSLDIPGFSSVLSYTSGDFDGDGREDLAFHAKQSVGGALRVAWLRGLQSGAFAAPAELPEFGTGIDRIVAMQLDGGPASEIAVHRTVSASERQVQVYGWTPAGFQLLTSSAVSSDFLGDVLLAADLNADGLEGLVLTTSASASGFASEVSVYPNLAGTLGPVYRPGIEVPTRSTLTAGDLDGDGDVDLLRHSEGELQVLRNLGIGLLEAESDLLIDLTEGSTIGTGVAKLRIQDLNQDGVADVVGTLDSQPTPLAPLEPGSKTIFIALYGDPEDAFSATGGTVPERLFLPASDDNTLAGIDDFDGDGRADLLGGRDLVDGRVGFTVFSDATKVAAWRDLDGDGDFDALLNGSEGLQQLVQDGSGALSAIDLGLPLEVFSGGGIATGADLDADGRPEVLVAEWFFNPDPGIPNTQLGWSRYELEPGVGYQDVGPFNPPSGFQNVQNTNLQLSFAADVNGDGHQDLVTGSGYMPGDGTGALGPGIQVTTLFKEWVIAASDLDSDGDLDLFTWRPTDGVLRFYRAEPSGYAIQTLIESRAAGSGIVIEDFDGDQIPEVAVTRELPSPSDDTVLEIFSQGPSGLVLVASYPLAPGDTIDLGRADLDGDGVKDIVTTGGFSRRLTVLRGQPGSGLAFGPPETYPTPTFLILRDLEGDGDLDVVGASIHRGLREQPPVADQKLQYGTGTPGTGGAVPLLGATGTFTAGSSDAELRLVGTVGSGLGVFAVSSAQAQLVDHPLPGVTTWIQPPSNLSPLVTNGAAGLAGDGSWSANLQFSPAFAGLTFFAQAFVVDPGAASGLSASNGLRITFGL